MYELQFLSSTCFKNGTRVHVYDFPYEMNKIKFIALYLPLVNNVEWVPIELNIANLY